jgi:hypothetical protein
MVAVEFLIQAFALDEFIVRAFLDYTSVIEDIGTVSLFHGAQAMRNDQGGSPTQKI